MEAESTETVTFLEFILSYPSRPACAGGDRELRFVRDARAAGKPRAVCRRGSDRPGALTAFAVAGVAAVILAWCRAGSRSGSYCAFATSWA